MTVKTDTGEKVTRHVGLAGEDAQGWAALNGALDRVREERPADEPSPLEVFGSTEHEEALQAELEAQEAQRTERGLTAYDVFNAGNAA